MKIIIASDGSPNSIAAAEIICKRRFPKELIVKVISVATPGYTLIKQGLSQEMAQLAVGNTVDKLKNNNFVVEGHVLEGQPADKILEVIKTDNPDMLFIGPHAKGLLQTTFLGNTARTIIDKCHCSVTVVRADSESSNTTAYRCLICIDGVIDEKPFWQKSLSFWPKDSQFLLVNVADPPISAGSENPKIDAKLFLEGIEKKRILMKDMIDQQVQQFRSIWPEARVEGHVVQAVEVAETILKTAKVWKANLIVMYPRVRQGIDKFLLGSVSSLVTQQATCSVEIVRDA